MEKDSDSGSSSEDDQIDDLKPKKEKNEQFLLSELLNQSFFRAKSLSDQIDQDAQDRMRDIRSELSELDYKKEKEAKEKRRSSVMQNQSPNPRTSLFSSPTTYNRKSSTLSPVSDSPKPVDAVDAGANDGSAAESLASILAGINLTEDFKQLDSLLNDEAKQREPGAMSLDDLGVHYEVFQNIITRSTKKHSERKARLVLAVRALQAALTQQLAHAVHAYKTAKGFYKFEHRIQELEHVLVKAKAALAEKRYALKLQSSERLSVDELRAKFEKETEELVRSLIQSINNITGNVASLQKKNERVGEETETLLKQLGEALHALDKEDKLAKQALLAQQQQQQLSQSQSQPSVDAAAQQGGAEEPEEGLYEVFAFLQEAVELSEEHVFLAQQLSSAEATAQTRERLALAQLQADAEAQQQRLQEMQRSEEARALERLKRMIANTQDK
eukprot:gene32953-39855_t